MTVREASDFWDTHSFLDYDDVKEVEFDVDIKESKHYVVVDSEIALKVHTLARSKKKSEREVVNSLLRESLAKVA
jgi:hypothetical protein